MGLPPRGVFGALLQQPVMYGPHVQSRVTISNVGRGNGSDTSDLATDLTAARRRAKSPPRVGDVGGRRSGREPWD